MGNENDVSAESGGNESETYLDPECNGLGYKVDDRVEEIEEATKVDMRVVGMEDNEEVDMI